MKLRKTNTIRRLAHNWQPTAQVNARYTYTIQSGSSEQRPHRTCVSVPRKTCFVFGLLLLCVRENTKLRRGMGFTLCVYVFQWSIRSLWGWQRIRCERGQPASQIVSHSAGRWLVISSWWRWWWVFASSESVKRQEGGKVIWYRTFVQLHTIARRREIHTGEIQLFCQ